MKLFIVLEGQLFTAVPELFNSARKGLTGRHGAAGHVPGKQGGKPAGIFVRDIHFFRRGNDDFQHVGSPFVSMAFKRS